MLSSSLAWPNKKKAAKLEQAVRPIAMINDAQPDLAQPAPATAPTIAPEWMHMPFVHLVACN